MKTIVIAAPDQLPPEMADDPSVLVLDPASLDDELMAMLDAASGGMMGEDDESGEGALADWAAEEEKEPEHAKGGYGDEDEEETRQMSGEGDEDEESGEGDDAMDDPETRFGKGGRAGDEDEESGEGEEEDIDESKKPSGSGRGAMGYGKMGYGKMGYGKMGHAKGGKGLPPLAAWARSMGGMGRR
jgi:hypothetical protein